MLALFRAVALFAAEMVTANVLLPEISTALFPVIAVVALFVSAYAKFEKSGEAALSTALAVYAQLLVPITVFPL